MSQGGSFWQLQHFDTTNPFGETIVDDGRDLMWASRWKWYTRNGIPSFGQVDGTAGPVGGWLCLAKTGSTRQSAQWCQAFIGKVTSTGPTVVRPVKDSALTADADLGPVTVTVVDGSTPTVGDFGVVVAGTSLVTQAPLFFPKGAGGGGSTTVIWAKTTSNAGGGAYGAQQIQYPGGPDTVGGDFGSGTVYELNTATLVGIPTNIMLWYSSGDSKWYFDMPFESC